MLAAPILMLLAGSLVQETDVWALPPDSYVSPGRQFVLEEKWDFIRPPMLTLKKKINGSLKVIWKVKSPQGGPPVSVFFSPDGSVILINEWYQAGYDNVLCFIGPEGQVVAKYTLDKLQLQSEMAQFLKTKTSILWDKEAIFFFRNKNTEFGFETKARSIRLFDMGSGDMTVVPKSKSLLVEFDALLYQRPHLLSLDPKTRIQAATSLGIFRDRGSVPGLTKLLNDTYTETLEYAYRGRTYHLYKHPVQRAAGVSLVQILGDQAAPILSRKFKFPDKDNADNWRGVLRMASGPKTEAVLDQYKSQRKPWDSR